MPKIWHIESIVLTWDSTGEVQKQKQLSSSAVKHVISTSIYLSIYLCWFNSLFYCIRVNSFFFPCWLTSAAALKCCTTSATKTDLWPVCYHSLTLTRTLNNPGPGIFLSCCVFQWTVRSPSIGQWGRNLTWPQSSLCGDASPPRTSAPLDRETTKGTTCQLPEWNPCWKMKEGWKKNDEKRFLC